MGLIINKNGRTIVVNGKANVGTTIISGGTVTIDGGKITVDGKPLSELDVEDEKVINITIQGDIERLEVDYCQKIEVTGNVKRIKANNGDVSIGGDVQGDVHANMGTITCGNVEGDCHANMGNIYKR